MPQQTISLACTLARIVDRNNPNTNYSTSQNYKFVGFDGVNRQLLLKFDALPDNLQRVAILGIRLSAMFISSEAIRMGSEVHAEALKSSFTSGVTYSSRPAFLNIETSMQDDVTVPITGTATVMSDNDDNTAVRLVTSPAWAVVPGMEDYDEVRANYTLSNYHLEVDYNDDLVDVSMPAASNYKSGYVNPHVSQTFRWILNHWGPKSVQTANGFTQASAVFLWRQQGTSTWNTKNISGSTQSTTLAANTLPVGTIEWKVRVTDTFGTTNESQVYTIITTDSAARATPKSPINTIEDGSGPIKLTWSLNKPNSGVVGSVQVRYKLASASSWTSMTAISGAATSATIPAGTFPAGNVQWAVRATNADGSWGSWSSAASMIVISSPGAPVVNSDGAPYATITWQAQQQQAYRVVIDGSRQWTYGPFFGTERSFTLPEPLEDGRHTAAVQIQGAFGLWSEPGETEFEVRNIPGKVITLTVDFGADAELRWTTEAVVRNFVIYRDGKAIGETTGTSFTDRVVLGEHRYQIVNRLRLGLYTKSNIVSGVLKSCETRIGFFGGGGWTKLRLTESGSPEQRFTYSRPHSLRHVRGSKLPVLELSAYEDGSGSYTAAFQTVEELRIFEAYRGERVILKSRGGQVVIGALTTLNTRMCNFYIAVDFTLERCDWEDYHIE